MSSETWGQMAKSAVDSETVEEAVTRLIAEHEASPSAHLGDNESIAVHRAETVIDHPAGSVLADKKTMTELSIDHDFSSITPWTKTGTVSNSNWPDCTLYVEWGAVNTSRMRLSPQSPSPFDDYDYEATFQTVFRTDMTGSTLHGWFGIGLVDDTPTSGFGFVIQAGVLKAYIGMGATQRFQTITGATIWTAHIYRAQMVPQEDVCKFYIDGDLVAELAIPATSPDDDGGPDIGVRLSGSNDGNFIVSDLHFSRSLILPST